jgi:DNA invertase Pin-like site-specific DNA recombinase
MTETALRAAAYLRVSTAKQADNDLSLPDQKRHAQAHCERRGWKLVETFNEHGASALDEDRPEFQRMVDRACSKDHPFDVIVVHSFSRFSRDAMHSEFYTRKLRKAGVDIVSITQEFATDPAGDMARQMMNLFDQYSSAENAKHTRRAMIENARQGFWNGSRPPFGYKVEVKEKRGTKEKKALVIEPSEAAVVRQVFDLCRGAEAKSKGLKAIVTYLNDRGITRRGRAWGTGSLHDLLHDATYAGTSYFNRTDSRTLIAKKFSEWVPVAVPAIVTRGIFDSVQSLLADRRPVRVPGRALSSPTMLAGVAKCLACGAAMIVNTGSGRGGHYRYYACSTLIRKGRKHCVGLRVRMDKLDGQVLEMFAERLFRPERLAALLGAYVTANAATDKARKEKLRLAKERRGDVDASIVRLVDAIEHGIMTPDDPTLSERMSKLRLQRDELDQDIKRAQLDQGPGLSALNPERLAKLCAEMRKRFAEGPPELRQAYMKLLLEKAEVDGVETRLTGSKVLLAKFAETGGAFSVPEVLTYVREWRAVAGEAGHNWLRVI